MKKKELTPLSKRNSELTDEELASIALSSDETVDMGSLDPVLRYIRDNQVKVGDVRVVTYIIYWHYCNKWLPHSEKLKRATFFTMFKKYFGDRWGRANTYKYYLLDPHPFETLTKRERKLARAYGRKINRGKDKEKPQKSS